MRKTRKMIATLACLGLAFAGVAVYNVMPVKTTQAEGAVFECAGAGIRLDSTPDDGDNRTGIRFRVKMDKATLDTVGEVKVLVMPTDLIGEDNKLTIEDKKEGALEETLVDWNDFVTDEVDENGAPIVDSTYQQAYAYVYGMTEEEFNRPTTWCAYYLDSKNKPVYSSQMDRSLSEVAYSFKNDEKVTDEDRKALADEYILSYNVIYDHSVRGEDGKWKTTVREVNVPFGTPLTELPETEAPELEERADFEFLNEWKITKGIGQIQAKGEEMVVTGNVRKEAYWLLTGEISLDSAEKVAEYADLTSEGNTNTVVKENSTGKGIAFATNRGGNAIGRYTEYVHLDWKNIVVNTNLNCRFKGYVTSELQEGNNGTGKTKAYFETGETDQVLDDQIQHKEFDFFRTQDFSTFVEYGNGYYELADFILETNNNVEKVNQTATFEKFQIGAVDVINTVKSGNNAVYEDDTWAWKSEKTYGFNIVTSSGANGYTDITTVVSDSYLACTATKVGTGNKPVLRVKRTSSALAVGDKIVVKIKATQPVTISTEANTANIYEHFTFNGDNSKLSTGKEFGTAVITVNQACSEWWLYFAGTYDSAVDFVIESIEIQTSTITTDVPQFMSGANEGAASVTLDNEGTVNQGVITGTDNVKYAFVGTSTWGKDALTFNFKNITLNEGDQIYLKATGTAATVKVGTHEVAFDGDCDEVIFEVTADMTLEKIAFYVAEGSSESVEFILSKLYIVRKV